MSPSRILPTLWLSVTILFSLTGLAVSQEPQPAGSVASAFSYQGSLRSASAPAYGNFDFQFILYDAVSEGNRVGAVLAIEDVMVSGGRFTVQLDFGEAPFNGEARWLEVGVRPGDSTEDYTILAPRQPLTATPYALYATKAPWSGLQSVPAGFSDAVDNDTTYSAGTGLALIGTVFSADTAYLQRRVSGACGANSAVRIINSDGSVTCETDDNTTYSAGSGLTLSSTVFSADTGYLQRRVSGTCGANSSIRTINSDGSVTCETDDSGWALTGNAGTTPGTNFLGTTDNQALEFKVNGQRALRLEPVGSPIQNVNVIGGCASNQVATSFFGATIAGGGEFGSTCGATHDQPCWNRALAGYASVSGGLANTASGGVATVAGGQWNTASAGEAAVGGGYGNKAIGDYATVAGGFGNTAGGESWTGDYAAVPGGLNNTASGAYSFAAGRRAKANAAGAFVWADSTDEDFSSVTPDSFSVRASAGADIIARSGGYGLMANNQVPAGATDSGDGIRAFANTSKGSNWASMYAVNYGSSPAVYANSSGTYSGYFEDSIYVAGDCVGCTMAYLAVNTGDEALVIGDLVAADGMRPPLNEGAKPLLGVRGAAGGAVGVVARRAILVENEKDSVKSMSPQAASGPIEPGDHLFIVVYGLAQARVDATATPIEAGQRLTAASSASRARALRTVSVEGVPVAEAAPSIGIALEPLAEGQGMIWVMMAIK
jgi:hypothetical protein